MSLRRSHELHAISPRPDGRGLPNAAPEALSAPFATDPRGELKFMIAPKRVWSKVAFECLNADLPFLTQ